MPARRTLTLKREALQALTTDDLTAVVGGATLYSCMAFISCAIPFCLIDRSTLCVVG